VYAIPKDESLSQKENAPLQRAFFKHVYMLLIGKDTGPRLSTFLSALPRETVLALLTF
jgi:lysyl-tRNA synthetase class I